ncbi:MAG: hypothetical protein IJX77_10465 [Ruminococcus sp.]|nr:hypothetical protein [Ruminococcus sp.]
MKDFILEYDSWLENLGTIIIVIGIMLAVLVLVLIFLLIKQYKNKNLKSRNRKSKFAQAYADADLSWTGAGSQPENHNERREKKSAEKARPRKEAPRAVQMDVPGKKNVPRRTAAPAEQAGSTDEKAPKMLEFHFEYEEKYEI